MRSTFVVFLIWIVAVVDVLGQQVHEVPFAAPGNIIELSVENSGSVTAAELTVEVMNIPAWLKFGSSSITLPSLHPGSSVPARFSFDVDRTAPVGHRHTLTFAVHASDGQEWMKEMTVEVAPPESFRLFHNYPNPFNPSTIIACQLPRHARVSVKIYNLLAQEVAELAGYDFSPGYHELTWEASGCPSGMYVYQLVAEEDGGNRIVARRSMMLLK
jgi:hypothetical protein